MERTAVINHMTTVNYGFSINADNNVMYQRASYSNVKKILVDTSKNPVPAAEPGKLRIRKWMSATESQNGIATYEIQVMNIGDTVITGSRIYECLSSCVTYMNGRTKAFCSDDKEMSLKFLPEYRSESDGGEAELYLVLQKTEAYSFYVVINRAINPGEMVRILLSVKLKEQCLTSGPVENRTSVKYEYIDPETGEKREKGISDPTQQLTEENRDIIAASNDQIPVCRLHATMRVCYKRCKGRVTYRIILWNDGNIDASNVVVKDVMPGIIRFPTEDHVLLPGYITVTGGEVDENMPPMIGESHLFTIGIQNVKAFGTSVNNQVEIMVTGKLVN